MDQCLWRRDAHRRMVRRANAVLRNADGRSSGADRRETRGQEATLLLVLNAHHELVPFTLPSAPGGEAWRLLVDTHAPDDFEERKFDFTTQYDAKERSAALFSLA